MAGRDTPRGPGAQGEGRDMLSSMPDDVMIMDILPKLGWPDNQGKALVRLAGTNVRLRGIVEEFLARARDSYLAHLSLRYISKFDEMFRGRVSERLQRYMAAFPKRKLAHLFDDEQPPGIDENILNGILADPDALQHRYYRDLIRRIIEIYMEPMRPARPINVPLLRLMHLVGAPLDGVLSQAIIEGQVAAAEFALAHTDEQITQSDVMLVWRNQFVVVHPDMFQFIVANMDEPNVSPMIIHAMQFYADLRAAQPGHDQEIQILENVLDQRFATIIMYEDEANADRYTREQFEADVQRMEQEYADMFAEPDSP